MRRQVPLLRSFLAPPILPALKSRKGQDIWTSPMTWVLLLLFFIFMAIIISGAGKDIIGLIPHWGG